MSELISVIIPVYNVEPYLNLCIDSVLRQTYRNIEIILINDGSTDNSGMICDSYAKKHANIRVVHQENGGLSDARNKGIELAKGKYLFFLDSDDWLDENCLATLHRLLKDNDCEIAAGNYIETDSEQEKINISESKYHVYTNAEALEALSAAYYAQLVIACAKLYHHRLFDDIRFPYGRLHEDEFTTYKLLYKARKTVLTTSFVLYYRQREGSIMKSEFTQKRRMDILDAFWERADFLRDKGLKGLSGKAYQTVFTICMKIFSNTDNVEIGPSYKAAVEGRLKACRKDFINSTSYARFHFFYRLYFTLPRMAVWLYGVYNRITRQKGNNS